MGSSDAATGDADFSEGHVGMEVKLTLTAKVAAEGCARFEARDRSRRARPSDAERHERHTF
jgi:hypothetical protein